MHKNYLVGYKLLFGLLGLAAVITEIAVLAERGTWNPVNFFSFFTIESNIIAAATLIAGAFLAFAGKKKPGFDFIRGAATLYMIVTGIVFAVLLAGLEGAQLTAVPWDNIVLHYIIPIAIALDWLMDPPTRRIRFKPALLWLSFPIVYLAYSLVRGALVGWYPYPFLNPANGGYGAIAVTSLAITGGGIAAVYLLIRIQSLKKK